MGLKMAIVRKGILGSVIVSAVLAFMMVPGLMLQDVKASEGSGSEFEDGSLSFGPSMMVAKAEKGKKEELKLEEPKQKPKVIGPSTFGQQFKERVLDLGVHERFIEVERGLFKAQIKSFIPPLLQPVLGNSAFILPPNTFQFATNFKFVNLDGGDFFKNNDPNPTFFDKGTRRQFLTASIRYGFDLNRKFLHSFTAVVNIPYLNAQSTGSGMLPAAGGGFINVANGGNSQGLGDISLFLKKKLLDQANENKIFGITLPIGMAVAAGVFFPTGEDNQKAGQNGQIAVKKPDGTFANTTFKRFSNDGRLPAGLQPGTGTFSYQFGMFFTRQFVPGDMPDFLAGTVLDRAALHWGGTHRINFEHNGIRRGDVTTLFLVGAIPLYKDYLSFHLNSINQYKQFDSYDGVFCAPNNTICNGQPGGNPALSPRRQPFAQGWTSLFGPSLIYSPDPVIRLTAAALFRIKDPNLGPAPPYVLQFGSTVIF